MDHGVLYDESRSVPPRPSIDTFRQDPILKLSNPSLYGQRNRIKAET
jgi:hypothetical protein